MKVTAKLIIVLLVCVSPVPAEHSTGGQGIAGIVADTQSVPIPHARVVVVSESDGAVILAGVSKEGIFEVQVHSGYYDVMAAAKGFAPVSRKVLVGSGMSRFHPKLGADVEHLED